MTNWFSKNLGDAMLAHEPLGCLENYLLSTYTKAEMPAQMAVFMRHESEGRLHCEVKVYFSPASVDVARALDAEPCEKPSSDGLSLLAGCEDAWLILFPERSR